MLGNTGPYGMCAFVECMGVCWDNSINSICILMWCPILEETAKEPCLQKHDSLIIRLSSHFSQGEGLAILELSDLLACTQQPTGEKQIILFFLFPFLLACVFLCFTLL